MENVIAYFAASFPPKERAYAASMRLVAEYLATTDVADQLEAVPFNCCGFGLFVPGSSTNLAAPFIGVWFDTSDPLYWVQIRTHHGVDGETRVLPLAQLSPIVGDGALLACEECHGVEDAADIVREFIPRLLALESNG